MAKLLLLTSEFPPFRGGVSTYAHELAAAAARDGHEVVVVAPDYGADQTAGDAARPYRVRRYRDGPANVRGLPRRFAATWRALLAERFDMVHAIDWPFFLPVRMSVRRGKPEMLLTLYGTDILYMRHPKRRRVLDALRFWAPDWARWIAISRYTLDLALANLPIAPDRIRAIPLGVSDPWLDGRVDRAAARAATGAGDRFVIVSLGRIVERKGHAVLAEALARAAPRIGQRIAWWIIGPEIDETFAASLREQAATLPVDCEFLGTLPDEEVRRRLCAADLFCLPGFQDEGGRVEGFGLVFLEAAALDLPSLATRSGGIPEAIDDGETGLLVPERDPAALADALVRLAGDPQRRAEMAVAARQRAERSSWPHVMRETYGLAKAR